MTASPVRVAALFCSLILAACASAPRRGTGARGPAELSEIDGLEERRRTADGRLSALCAHPAPVVRARALLALGRIQDPSTAQVISKALKDPDGSVRLHAAFAASLLGLSWSPLPEDVRIALTLQVLAAEGKESELPVRGMLLRALGDLGTLAALERLTDRLSDDKEEVRVRSALALGVAVKRGGTFPVKAAAPLASLLKKEASAESRYAAAYLLAFSKTASNRGALLVCTQDAEVDVRALCARGLGDVGQDADAVTLGKLLEDADFRVAVEAARALAKLSDRCKGTSCLAVGALSGLGTWAERLGRGQATAGHPVQVVAQQAVPASVRPVLVSLRQKLAEGMLKLEGGARFNAASVDCQLAAALDRLGGTLLEVKTCGASLVSEGQRLAWGLRRLAEGPAPKDARARLKEVQPFLSHPEPRVRTAAVEALKDARIKDTAELLRPLLKDEDPHLAGVVAAVLGNQKDAAAVAPLGALLSSVGEKPELAEPVTDALANLGAKEAEAPLRALLQAPEAHTRQVAAAALTRLTGQKVQPLNVEHAATAAPAPVWAKKGGRVVLTTAEGEITIRLWTDDAPRTSANFWKLAKDGRYQDLTFHRVVPAFVAQSGDPRADGEGGPGYQIRCEVNARPYARHVVGMALSGKDTGGSQFFITTTRQPHLDGRYTAFGEVVKGQEQVDALLEGAQLLGARVEEG